MKSLFLLFIAFFVLNLSAIIINIPADQPNIQEGINIAVDSDTVLVQPGTYIENINYNGKNITVASLFLTTQDTIYISQTIIDANHYFGVASFLSGEDSTSILTGFTITNGNVYQGGGISCYNNSNPSLENLIITSNVTGSGGGIYCDNSSPSLINVTISGNTASDYGGGISCWDNSNPSLQNVTISDNNTWNGNGGGISCSYNSNPSLINVTISGNTASDYGGGIFCHDNSSPTLINSILWNDLPQEVYFCDNEDLNSVTISYSDIQGGEAGIVTNNNGTVYWLEGNLDDDPLFVGAGEEPYSLLEDSPCIDTGIPDTTGFNLPPWDIIGNLRVWDGDENGSAIIDMGAYEYGALPYVDICENEIIQTSEVNLYQNYPNPFNPTTTISFSISKESKVELTIYNIKGQKITSLLSNQLTSGEHSIVWNGTDDNNKLVSSGIYLYKLKVNNKTEAVRKCLLLK